MSLSARGTPSLDWPAELPARLDAAAGDPAAALDLAGQLAAITPLPGAGATVGVWEMLATLGAVDLTVARAIEPHLDALAILAQAPGPPDLAAIGASASSRWGVFAAHAAGARLEAVRRGDGWVLTGTKPWCSLADRLSHAIVTAHTGETTRRAFAVRLDHPGVEIVPQPWVARGLAAVASPATRFVAVPAVAVGPDDWYLDRPGFGWGGMGVAACWYGGAVGLARALTAAAHRREPDQIALMHLGAVDTSLHAARSALAEAAGLVDAGGADGEAGSVLARRVRGIVAASAEDVIARVGHALGPAPLCHDEQHAARVADLQVYLRQHHAERDDAALAAALLARGRPPW